MLLSRILDRFPLICQNCITLVVPFAAKVVLKNARAVEGLNRDLTGFHLLTVSTLLRRHVHAASH